MGAPLLASQFEDADMSRADDLPTFATDLQPAVDVGR